MLHADKIMCRVFILVALSFAISACGEKKPESQYVLKEVIDVKGTCAEDHVAQRDNYAGQIVRWQAADTGKISTYGFLSKEGDPIQHISERVTHPHVYHTPEMISFLEIDIDTDQSNWVLHGVSDRSAENTSDGGEDADIKGYNSTCNLDVIKRGMEIHDFPLAGKLPPPAEKIVPNR